MPMPSNDLRNAKRDEIRARMQQAIREENSEGFYQAFDEMLEVIGQSLTADYQQRVEELRAEYDTAALTARGRKPLTSEERKYYQALSAAMKSANPKQALTDADLVLPETVINRVFDELQTSHPLLSRINFVYTGGAIKLLMNTNGYQEAQWGKLCDDIVQELLAGFVEVDTTLLKLSAFLPVCKAMLDLGPEWLDNFVRQTLYEALSNGLEAGSLTGTGKDMPIGMNRQVGAGVTVTDGVYPEKEAIAVNDLSAGTIGNLLSLLAVDPNGKPRQVRDVLLVVNPQDYFQKVFPATTVMAPDGTFRNDVMPYPMTVIPSPALSRGEAILGLGYRYFAPVGMAPQGRIEYSDHYRFLEDDRVYLIKLYANGVPMDNNAFLKLDISGLQPLAYKVELVEPAAPSTDATLASLRIGALTLTPAFDAATTEYEAETENATNTVTAMPADAGASVGIKVGDVEINNGTAATWEAGENTVTITVTAADGTTTEVYTVTVTKS